MREQIGETHEGLPTCRCAGEPVIEARIKNQVLACGIANCPKAANCIALQEGLRETPYFRRQSEPFQEGMRNGQGLTELTTPHRSLLQFGEKDVCVIVKSLHIRTGQDQKRVGGAAVVKLRSAAIIYTMKETDGQCWRCVFPVIKHTLCTQKNIRHAASASPVSCKVRYRFSNSQKLQTRCDGKLYDFVEAILRRKLRRMAGRHKTGLQLEIPDRSECGWSRDSRTAGICFWFINVPGLRSHGLGHKSQKQEQSNRNELQFFPR